MILFINVFTSTSEFDAPQFLKPQWYSSRKKYINMYYKSRVDPRWYGTRGTNSFIASNAAASTIRYFVFWQPTRPISIENQHAFIHKYIFIFTITNLARIRRSCGPVGYLQTNGVTQSQVSQIKLSWKLSREVLESSRYFKESGGVLNIE